MQDFEKIRINDDREFNCFYVSLSEFDCSAVIDSTDYEDVKKALEHITSIDVYDMDGIFRNRTTEYTGYSTLEFIKGAYKKEVGTDSNGRPIRKYVDTLRVHFEKASVEDRVKELEETINYKIDESAMTLEEYKQYRIQQIGEVCRKTIHDGVDVEISSGIERFTYTADDQANIKALFDSAIVAQVDVPYHGRQRCCTVFKWQDIVKIYVALQTHLLYHTTYCNALNMYIRMNCDTKAQVAAVTYGQEVPEIRKEEMDKALEQGKVLMDAIIEKYGLKEDTNAKEPEIIE